MFDMGSLTFLLCAPSFLICKRGVGHGTYAKLLPVLLSSESLPAVSLQGRGLFWEVPASPGVSPRSSESLSAVSPTLPAVFLLLSFLPPAAASASKVLKSWKVSCAPSQGMWPDGSQNLSWVSTLFLAFLAKTEEESSLQVWKGLFHRETDTLALNSLF